LCPYITAGYRGTPNDKTINLVKTTKLPFIGV
jgi:hypothetical protein